MYWWILLFAIIFVSFGNQNQLLSADAPENAPTNISAKNHIDEVTLFEEPFENVNWASRGWYDGPKMEITSSEHIAGSKYSCVWHWKKTRDIGTVGKGGRVLLKPVSSVIISFYIKHSANWKWTGVNWHPHEFHFVTDVDPVNMINGFSHSTLD